MPITRIVPPRANIRADWSVTVALFANAAQRPAAWVLQASTDRNPEVIAAFPFITDFTDQVISEIETAAFTPMERYIMHRWGKQGLLGF